MDNKTQPIFQPFCWIDDTETKHRLSNRELSHYRDVVSGCQLVVDLLHYDRLQDDCEPRQILFNLNDRSRLERLVSGLLHLMTEHIDAEIEWLLRRESAAITH